LDGSSKEILLIKKSLVKNNQRAQLPVVNTLRKSEISTIIAHLLIKKKNQTKILKTTGKKVRNNIDRRRFLIQNARKSYNIKGKFRETTGTVK